ncbi:hypothetical protein [Vreelandella sp. TE19]
MRLLAAVVLLCIGFVFTVASSAGYPSREALLFDVFLTIIVVPSLMALPFCLLKAGRNLRRFFLVFNIVLSAIIVSKVKYLPLDTKSDQAATSRSPMSTKRVVSNHGSLSIPKDWKNKKPEFSNVFISVESKEREAYIYVGYDVRQVGESLEDYADSLKANFIEFLYDTQFITQPADCGLEEIECIYQMFTIESETQATTSVFAYVKGAEGYYRFMATTSTELWEEHSNVIFDILRSFTPENSE